MLATLSAVKMKLTALAPFQAVSVMFLAMYAVTVVMTFTTHALRHHHHLSVSFTHQQVRQICLDRKINSCCYL